MSIATSILIRTKNEAKDLPKALDLIRNQSLKPVDIVVVDSGSTDGTVEFVTQQKDVKLIQMPATEFTYGRSLNLGFQAVKGEIIVSLSAHAFPCDSSWLQNLVKHFEDPQVAGVYGKQVPQPDAWPPVRRDYLNYYQDHLKIQTNPENNGDRRFSNANSAIRYQCWRQHQFDETLTYSEDREWGDAMLKLGYKLIYEPKAAVYHSHNEPLLKVYRRSYGQALAAKTLYDSKKSLWGFLNLWLNSTKADLRFILKSGKELTWLLRSPLYRFFLLYGHFNAYLPDAIGKSLFVQWTKVNSLQKQKE